MSRLSLLSEALEARPWLRYVGAIGLAAVLHVVIFTVLHVRRGPPPPPPVDLIPYVDATDMSLDPLDATP